MLLKPTENVTDIYEVNKKEKQSRKTQAHRSGFGGKVFAARREGAHRKGKTTVLTTKNVGKEGHFTFNLKGKREVPGEEEEAKLNKRERCTKDGEEL